MWLSHGWASPVMAQGGHGGERLEHDPSGVRSRRRAVADPVKETLARRLADRVLSGDSNRAGCARIVIVERNAIRAIVLTPEREVLLMRIRAPEGGDWFWITPGGGLETGESVETGLRRELNEELGLERFDVGPLVWRRQHTFNWDGRRILQRERYHVVHVPRFDPQMSDAVEAKVLDQFRWWRTDELAQARERLTPVSLAQIVRRYLEEGPPAEVSHVEVLVD